MKKPKELKYNPHLSNLIEDAIPCDRKTYNSLSGFITQQLRKQLDDEILEKIAHILDDPKHEYDKDLDMTKILLNNFLPSLKKRLHISKARPLHKRIFSLEPVLQSDGENVVQEPMFVTTNPLVLDRLITQQLKFYHSDESASLLEVLLQGKNDIQALDHQLMEAKKTRKSTIANILVFMLLEEENQKHDVKSTSKKNRS